MRTRMNLRINTYMNENGQFIVIKSKRNVIQYQNWDIVDALRDFLLNIYNI